MTEILIDSPSLLQKATRWDFQTYAPKELNELAELLAVTAQKYDAVSLSAPQIGIDAAVFVMKDIPYMVCVNPRVVHEFDEMAMGTEACASFPGLAVKVIRPYKIRVRYQTVVGDVMTVVLEGGPARLFQHEMTHMNGTLFWNDANFLNKNKAIKDWKLIKRKIKKGF